MKNESNMFEIIIVGCSDKLWVGKQEPFNRMVSIQFEMDSNMRIKFEKNKREKNVWIRIQIYQMKWDQNEILSVAMWF